MTLCSLFCRLPLKAEPPPTRDEHRPVLHDGTNRANRSRHGSGGLAGTARRLVRPIVKCLNNRRTPQPTKAPPAISPKIGNSSQRHRLQIRDSTAIRFNHFRFILITYRTFRLVNDGLSPIAFQQSVLRGSIGNRPAEWREFEQKQTKGTKHGWEFLPQKITRNTPGMGPWSAIEKINVAA